MRMLLELKLHQEEEEDQVSKEEEEEEMDKSIQIKEEGQTSLIKVSITEDMVETNSHKGLINPIFNATIVRGMVILLMNVGRNKDI